MQRHCGVAVLGDRENPLDMAVRNLLSPDVLCVGGETVGPLQDPSYLCASVIP